jgi:hypothetical protein
MGNMYLGVLMLIQSMLFYWEVISNDVLHWETTGVECETDLMSKNLG